MTATLSKLSKLTELNLSKNALNGIIPEILSDLPVIRSIDLSSNQLIGNIPASIGKLRSLETLWLDFNLLVGPIPESIGNLENLMYVHCSTRLVLPRHDINASCLQIARRFGRVAVVSCA